MARLPYMDSGGLGRRGLMQLGSAGASYYSSHYDPTRGYDPFLQQEAQDFQSAFAAANRAKTSGDDRFSPFRYGSTARRQFPGVFDNPSLEEYQPAAGTYFSNTQYPEAAPQQQAQQQSIPRRPAPTALESYRNDFTDNGRYDPTGYLKDHPDTTRPFVPIIGKGGTYQDRQY